VPGSKHEVAKVESAKRRLAEVVQSEDSTEEEERKV
jgi:hypothetical protein